MLASLVKTRIKVQFAALFKGLRYKKKGKFLTAVIIILAALLSGYISLTCGLLFKSMILNFHACGRMAEFFSVIIFLYLAASLLAACAIINAQLYDSADNQLLFAMPIPVGYILISRLSVVMIVDYMIDAFMLVPAAAVTVMYSGVPAVTVMLFSFLFFLLPVFSAAVSMLAAAGIEWCKIKFKNDGIAVLVLAAVTGCLAVVLLKFYYVILTSENGSMDTSAFWYISVFLPLGKAVIRQNVIVIISAAAACVLVFAGSFALVSRTMLYMVVHRRKRQRTRKELKHSRRHRSTKHALLVKEWRMFWSNPAIFFHTCAGYILLFIVTVILMIKGDLFIALYNEQLLGFHGLAGLHDLAYMVLIFFTGLNTFSASSITLEGKSFWITQMMPVKRQYILNAKAGISIFIGMPIMLMYCAVCSLQNLMAVKMGVFAFINAVLMAAACSYIGLFINIKFPVFDWVNVTAAVKQSAAALLSTLVNMLVEVIVIGVYIWLSVMPLGYGMKCAAVTVLLAAVMVFLYWLEKTIVK